MKFNLKYQIAFDRMGVAMNSTETARTTVEEFPHPVSDSRCHVRVVSTIAEFDELEIKWDKLLDESTATVFQSFEWLRTWWKYYGNPSYRLNILLFIYNNQIVAIAPLFKQEVSVLGMRFISRLQFIGRTLSDYLDIIIRPGYEQFVLNSLALHLRATAKEWDVFDIEDVNESSVIMKYLPGIMDNHGLKLYHYQGNVCPQILLPDSTSLAPTNSYNFKRKFKRLQQGFKTDVQLIQRESDDIEGGIEAFAYVHGQRWKSLGYPSAFDDEKLRAFHTEFSSKFARRGWLKLYIVRVNDEPIAVTYHFNYNKHIYMYHSNACGPDDVMRCSPGYLIRSISMADGIKEEMKVFDFLRGDESYKYTEWNAVDSRNYLLRSSSPSPTGSVRFAMFVAYELLAKGVHRFHREFSEYKRFTIVKDRSTTEKVRYIGAKVVDLLTLGYHFIVRHSPFRVIHPLNIQQSSVANEAEKKSVENPILKV